MESGDGLLLMQVDPWARLCKDSCRRGRNVQLLLSCEIQRHELPCELLLSAHVVPGPWFLMLAVSCANEGVLIVAENKEQQDKRGRYWQSRFQRFRALIKSFVQVLTRSQ